MNTNNQAFPGEADKNVFIALAEKMGDIRVIFVKRGEYEHRLREASLLSSINTEAQNASKYELFVPEDVRYLEQLQYIEILGQKFWNTSSSKIPILLQKIRAAIGIFSRTAWEEGTRKYVEDSIVQNHISSHLVQEILEWPIRPHPELRKFIKRLLANKDSLEEELWKDIQTEFIHQLLHRWKELLRTQMKTLTQDEIDLQKQTRPRKQPKLNFFRRWDRHTNHRFDQDERLLRDKIEIDSLKSMLEEVRRSGNRKRIAKEELFATNRVIYHLHEYHHDYKRDYSQWFQPMDMLWSKEIYCVWMSLLGHIFLSELDIEHKCIEIPYHAALEVNIGESRHYFDPHVCSEVNEFFTIKRWWIQEKIVFILNGRRSIKGLVYNIRIRLQPGEVCWHSWDTVSFLLAMLLHNEWASYASASRYDEAILLYKKALEVNPGKSMSYECIWDIYWYQGRYKESLIEYEKALILDPENASISEKINALLAETIEP